MAISFWGKRHTTQTTARLLARSTVNGTLTLTCNGQTFTGTTIDTSVQDGVGIVEATGLSADTSYSFTLSVGGSGVSGTLKTLPSSGELRFTWTSCFNRTRDCSCVTDAILATDPHFHVDLGDWIYTSVGGSAHGVTVLNTPWTLAQAKDVSNYYPFWHSMHRNPGIIQLEQAVSLYMQRDDHDNGPGNDTDHTVTTANAGGGGISAVTQIDVDDAWWAGQQCVIAYHQGNPENTDPEAVAQKPSNADASTPESHYPPRYYRFSPMPGVECFVTEHISHRSPLSAPTEMLGTAQTAWLQARMLASQAVFKIWLSPKQMFNMLSDNPDTFGNYPAPRDAIWSWIHSNVTGVAALTGDSHRPNVFSKSVSNGDTFDMLQVNACPAGSKLENKGVGYANGNVYAFNGYAAAPPRNTQVFGGVRIPEDRSYMELTIYEGRVSSERSVPVLWRGRVYAGSNALTYPESSGLSL